jgi:hypothetical protein
MYSSSVTTTTRVPGCPDDVETQTQPFTPPFIPPMNNDDGVAETLTQPMNDDEAVVDDLPVEDVVVDDQEVEEEEEDGEMTQVYMPVDALLPVDDVDMDVQIDDMVVDANESRATFVENTEDKKEPEENEDVSERSIKRLKLITQASSSYSSLSSSSSSSSFSSSSSSFTPSKSMQDKTALLPDCLSTDNLDNALEGRTKRLSRAAKDAVQKVQDALIEIAALEASVSREKIDMQRASVQLKIAMLEKQRQQ